MENFNFNLKLYPDECNFDGKKIKFCQKLPRPLILDNYEVALTEFTSHALNNSVGFYALENLLEMISLLQKSIIVIKAKQI